MVEGHRIAGERNIQPDEETVIAMQHAGVKATPAVKLCIGLDGVPTEITIMRPSCFPRYDAQIKLRMSEWRYSPYLVDGVGVRVCTSVTFIFRVR